LRGARASWKAASLPPLQYVACKHDEWAWTMRVCACGRVAVCAYASCGVLLARARISMIRSFVMHIDHQCSERAYVYSRSRWCVCEKKGQYMPYGVSMDVQCVRTCPCFWLCSELHGSTRFRFFFFFFGLCYSRWCVPACVCLSVCVPPVASSSLSLSLFFSVVACSFSFFFSFFRFFFHSSTDSKEEHTLYQEHHGIFFFPFIYILKKEEKYIQRWREEEQRTHSNWVCHHATF